MSKANDNADLRIEDGPPGWRIWCAEKAGAPGSDGWEALIYSDAHLEGDIAEGLGPFQLFVTIAEPLTNTLAPRLILRIRRHDPGTPAKRSKTKIKKEGSQWLALNVDEEIACLLSLITGCRLRSGGKVRQFSSDDPLGRPIYAEHTTPVGLAPAYRVPMLPHLTGIRLPLRTVIGFLTMYPRLGAHHAVALVRAARHYSTAIWVAENDPEQAWLQLVAALETVATVWRTSSADPAGLFASHFPEPARLIKQAEDGEQLLAAISRHFMPLIGATQRFEDFIETFKPDAPHDRPPAATNASATVDWTNLRPIVRTIYSHRSALLHNGTPWPADLCLPPLMIDGIPEERPLGITSTVGNTTWTAAETPIRLHTFAYLAQGAILNWWANTVTETQL